MRKASSLSNFHVTYFQSIGSISGFRPLHPGVSFDQGALGLAQYCEERHTWFPNPLSYLSRILGIYFTDIHFVGKDVD